MALTRPEWVVNTIQSLANKVAGQATAVKTAFDKAASDIKTYTTTMCTEIEAQFATKAELISAVIGAPPMNSLTEAQMADEMKKQAGGVAEYDTLATHVEKNSIDAHGATPACRVYNGGDQSIETATLTPLAFNVERFDNGSIHDVAINNTRLTCKTAGIYLITGNISWASNSTGSRQLILLLNGTTNIAYIEDSADNAGGLRQNISTVYSLNVDDYIEMQVAQSSGAPLNIRSIPNCSPEFSMVKIG